MVQTVNPRPRFRTSYEVNLLVGRLTKLEKGDQVSYAELNRLIESDVTGRSRPALTSARKIAERDHGVVTDVIPKVGLKRCTDPEIVLLLETANSRVRRRLRAAVQTTLRVDIEQLDESHMGKLTDELQKTTLTSMVLDPKHTAVGAARAFMHQSDVPMSVADDLKRLMASHNKRH